MIHTAGSVLPGVQSVDWLALAPPTVAALAALVVLVADLFLPAARKGLLAWLTGLALLAAAAPLPLLRGPGHDRTFCLPGAGHGAAAQVCSYHADGLTLVVQALVLAAAFTTALLSAATVTEQRLPAGEYWFLLLSATAGAALVPASRDLVTLVVALEVASLPAFALVGLRRGSAESAEAALKFFLSSVVATAVTLLGAGFLYATTGTLDVHGISTGLAHVPPQLHALATAGIALTFVGFAFKASVVPFHFWVPETYVGAPVPVAAFLSVVGKAAGLSGLLVLVVDAFRSRPGIWGPLLAVLAAATMTVGNAAALRQRSDARHGAVRLLAWSSVGQAGYLLVPLAAAAHLGHSRHALLTAVGAALAYLLMYGAVNLGAFAVAAHVARTAPAHRLDDYRGLWATNPAAALALAFFLLCLAGLPPGVIGLFTKVAIFSTAVDGRLGWLAAVMAVNVVLALFYYLKWTALLFRPAAGAPAEPARLPRSLSAAVALTAGVGVVLSLDPELVLALAAGSLG